MKIILSAILLSLGLQAHAAPIQGPALDAYKKATIAAMEDNQSTCYYEGGIFAGGWLVKEIIKLATSVDVSNGDQPLLLFSSPVNQQGTEMVQFAITTDSTFKKIVKIEGFDYNTGTINDGDLLNPVVREGYVLKRKCQVR